MDTTVFCQGCLSTKNLVLFCINEHGNKFKMCYNLTVGSGVTPLKWICKTCIHSLNDALQFRNLIENTQQYIMEHFKGTHKQFEAEINVKFEKPNIEALKIETLKIEFDPHFDNFDDQAVEPFEDIKPVLKNEKEVELEIVQQACTKAAPKKEVSKKNVKRKREATPAVTPIKKEKRKCKTCSQEFDNECSLAVHKVNEHAGKANVPEFAVTLVCNYCHLNFTELDDMRQHLLIQHNENELKVNWTTRNLVPCKICGFHFRDYSVRSYHVQNAHKLKSIPKDMLEKCSECEQRFENYLQQVTHMYEKHKVNLARPAGCVMLTCEPCGYAFAQYSAYSLHMKVRHKAEVLASKRYRRCQFCRLFFRFKPDLDCHLPVHAELAPKKRRLPELRFKCTKCNERFLLKSLQRKHLEDAHNIRDIYPCEFCGLELSTSTALKTHKNRIHTKKVEAICDYCGYVTLEKHYLLSHFRTHSEYKPFSCRVCQKRFKARNNLKQHERIHFEKQFCCQFCDLKFTHKPNLKSHMTRNHNQTCITDKSLISDDLL